MQQCKLGSQSVPALGLGCMNLNHAYGRGPSEQDAIALIHEAYELGLRHFDTASLYGFGANEILVGKAIQPFRQHIHLASKCGMTGVNGQRVIDGRPETLIKTIDESLQRLQVEYIDLYYLHRWDKNIPIEESMGALKGLVEQGKIGGIGLSEVSASTLEKAHAVHPITALQSEYSLWTRNPEIACLKKCQDLGITFVAFSPLGRGFLTAKSREAALLEEGDIRRQMPRFQKENFSNNEKYLFEFCRLAEVAQCTPAQLALSWLLKQGEHIMAIPGTRNMIHLQENIKTLSLDIDESILKQSGNLIHHGLISGHRYPENNQAEIDTEAFI